MKIRVKESMSCFFMAFIMVYTSILFEHTAIKYARILKIICYILGAGFLLLSYIVQYKLRIRKRNTVSGYIVLLIAVIISSFIIMTKDFYLFFVFMLGFRACNMDDDEMITLLNISSYMCLGFLILIPLLSVCGVIPNLNFIRGIGGEDRYAYGFNHSQVFPVVLTYFFFMVYATKKKVHFAGFIITQVAAIIAYWIFDSRNGLLTLEFFFVVHVCSCIIRKFNRKINEWLCNVGKIIIFIAAILSFLFMELYRNGNKIAIAIDNILSHRLREPLVYFAGGYKDFFEIRSYGTFYKMLTDVGNTVDNTFFYIVLRYGIVMLILFCIFYNLGFKYCSRQNNVMMCEVIIVVAISLVITNSVTSYFFPFLIISSREMWMMAIGVIQKLDEKKHIKQGYEINAE